MARAYTQPAVKPAADSHYVQSQEILLDDVSVRRLVTHADISEVIHLRGEIDLSAHLAGDPAFFEREKKETKLALSSPSSGWAKQSGRFAPFQCSMA